MESPPTDTATAGGLVQGPDAMTPRFMRISRVRRETHDVKTFEIEDPDATGPFGHQAGQFNMLYVFGVGEVPISISAEPGDSSKLIHTFRDVGTVTHAMMSMRRGDTIGVRGPYGTPWPIEECEGRDVIIIAGGIGLAPLRGAILRLLAERSRYGRITLLFGTRSPNDILFSDDLERWSTGAAMDLMVTVDHAGRGWQGDVGFVSNLIRRAQYDPTDAVALICGPEIMIRVAAAELLEEGQPADRIYISLERNMKCAVGFCGHCQFGPNFVCKDGPVFALDRVTDMLAVREF